MFPFCFFHIFVLILGFSRATKDHNVLMTEVFEIIIDPALFNWTYQTTKDQYVYDATLLNYPDLPSWVHFVYSERHQTAYIYGVAPNRNKAVYPIEIVGLNKLDYETRVETVNIVVSEKLNPARYEIHMKINNLNVEDMFEIERMEALKNIFRKTLWTDSEDDLYVTFLESAVELGARRPRNPNEGEGVIIRLGSESQFSNELLELQEEVRPLYVLPSCPREFKRTSVEIYFRDAGFSLDWCSFKLIRKTENNNSAMHKSPTEMEKEETPKNSKKAHHWQPMSRDEIPRRNYTKELLVTVTVPMSIMVALVLVLTFILCLQHKDLQDDESEYWFENLYHICIDWYNDRRRIDLSEETVVSETNPADPISQFSTFNSASDTLRSYINNQEKSVSPELGVSGGIHCRPSPPPYVKPKNYSFKPQI